MVGGAELSPAGFHGMALVDLGPLMYPGATRITGAYPVVPYSTSALDTARARVTGLSRFENTDSAPDESIADAESGGGGARDKGTKGGKDKGVWHHWYA